MSKLLLIALVVLALMGVASATGGHFETELAAEFPELAEQASGSPFLRLGDLAGELADDPATSFAELDAAAHAETEAEAEVEQPEAESEAEAEDTDVTFVETGAAPAPWHRATNQPVNRNGGDVQCLDGDCARAVGIKGRAAIGTHPNQGSPKPPSKLDIALDAVKEEIMVRAKELHLEKEWSKKVTVLIDEYQQKLAKVTGNIAHLRAQTKALLRKKKQIQNVQVQHKLRNKLRMAQADLNRLQKQMEHIAGKENEFSDTEKQLKTTMNALKNSLLKLRGQETQKLAAEGI